MEGRLSFTLKASKTKTSKKYLALICLVIFLLCAKFYCNSQSIKPGKYSPLAPLQYNYHYYIFAKNWEFEFATGADLGNDYYGKGTYQIEDSLLILNYNKTPLKNSSGYYRTQFWKNNSSTIQFTFKIMDLKGNPIPYSLAAILKDKIGENANNNGFVELTTKKSNVEKVIRVSRLGYEIISIEVFGNKNYHFDVYLKESDQMGTPIKNQIDTLKIKEFGNDYFMVLNGKKEIIWKKTK